MSYLHHFPLVLIHNHEHRLEGNVPSRVNIRNVLSSRDRAMDIPDPSPYPGHGPARSGAKRVYEQCLGLSVPVPTVPLHEPIPLILSESDRRQPNVRYELRMHTHSFQVCL